MKLFSFIAAMVFVAPMFFAGMAAAITAQWDDPNDPGVVSGFLLYFRATDGSDPADGSEYVARIPAETTESGQAYSYNLAGDKLRPGIEYQFELSAWNETAESERVGPVLYTTPEFIPPGENLPVNIYIRPTGPINITIGQ